MFVSHEPAPDSTITTGMATFAPVESVPKLNLKPEIPP